MVKTLSFCLSTPYLYFELIRKIYKNIFERSSATKEKALKWFSSLAINQKNYKQFDGSILKIIIQN